MIFRNFKCLLCDVGFTYLFYYGFCFINPFRMPFVASYFVFLGCYFLITFFVLKKSLFQYLLGIEIKEKSLSYLLFKILFLCIIPFLLTYRIGHLGLLLIFIYLFLANLISYIRKRKSIWERCARTKTTCDIQGKHTKLITCFILSLVIVLLCTTTIQYIVFLQKENIVTEARKGFNLADYLPPVNHTPVPVSQIRQRQYIEDIKKHKQEPFEYIMQLFENHDIVVLCERMHPEYTQWQLFSQLILNDTFASKVGNVATEFGRINSQAHLDSLLNISFYSEEERKKAFAALIRENGNMWSLWSNTNVYDFAVNLSKFNEKQEENRKINWFFCNVAGDWKDINNRKDWEDNNWGNMGGDSIMAHNIATVFDDLNKRGKPAKLLVIENTHHAYKEDRKYELVTADYLYQQYGEKVAFVWINNEISGSIVNYPYQMGLLVNGAAAQIEDSAWALSFSSSILGEDCFDLIPRIITKRLKMKDMFNGMIFYMPLEKQYLKHGYDYILTDFKETLYQRNKIVFGERADEITQWQIDDYGFAKYHSEPQIIHGFYELNIIYYTVHYFILFWLLGCSISILKVRKRALLEKSARADL